MFDYKDTDPDLFGYSKRQRDAFGRFMFILGSVAMGTFLLVTLLVLKYVS